SPSNTRMARPVWKNSAPIMMNMGTGPSVKVVISAVELSTICVNAGVPPMKIRAPMMLVVMKVNATGTPIAMKKMTIPIRVARAQYHSIGLHAVPLDQSGRVHVVDAHEVSQELDGQHQKAQRHRKVERPLRHVDAA